jgi:hypothetical protein
MTIKAMREKIAQARAVTRLDALLHPDNVGRILPITKHQKKSLRVDIDGRPFWVSLDSIEPLDDMTFAVIGPPGPYHNETLAIYRLEMDLA